MSNQNQQQGKGKCYLFKLLKAGILGIADSTDFIQASSALLLVALVSPLPSL